MMKPSLNVRAAIGLFLLGLAVFPAVLRAEDILVDPIDDVKHWALTGHRVNYVLGQSKLEVVNEPARPGSSGALKLTYDFERRAWMGIQWLGGPIPGRAEAVSFWLFGDGKKQKLSARLEDAARQIYDVPLGAVDWEGWRQVRVPMEEAQWHPIRRFADEPAPVRWPVILRELRISRAEVKPPLSSVVFAELRATSRVDPLDHLNIQIACDAPAHVFYLPEPVVLRVTLENPTATPFEGRLETVVDDWQGRSRRFEHGRLSVGAKASVGRTLEVPIQALGSYKAWVRFAIGDRVREASRQVAVSRKASGPAALEPSSPFGMGLYLPRFHIDEQLAQALTLAREAGVKWTRADLSPARFMPAEGRPVWDWPRWIAGKSGGAIEFSPGQNLTVPSSASLNRPCQTGELTLSCSLRFERLDYDGQWRTLLKKGDGANRQFFLFLTVPKRQLGISFGDGVNGWSDLPCTKTDWKAGQWYHLVVTHRRADRSVRWWVDGVPAGEGKTRSGATPVANDQPLEMGQQLDFALDDLALYDKALSPADLGQGKPVARWTFDEQKGLRVGDTSGHGNDIQVQPPRMDRIIKQSTQAGLSSYCIIMGTPAWMASKPTEGVERPWNIMPRLDQWSATLEAGVRHHAELGVHTWEIWNEPNIEPFWSPKPDSDEYYQVLAASYAAIKKVDPQAFVMGCSLAGPHGPSHRPPYEFVEEVLKRGGGKVMDAISIHPYRQPRAPEDSEYLDDLRAISDLTAKYGRRLPIWITEVGWPNGVGGASEAWSAQMIARSYLLAISAGVKNIAWYDYHDDGQDPSYNEHNFGVLWYDLTPKPAYFAYRTMATELAGMQFEREVPVGEGVSVLVFARGKQRTAVAWSHRQDVPVAMRLGGMQEIECVDLMGNARRHAVSDGALLGTLTGSPIFLRGVPDTFDVVRPIQSSPSVLKLSRGESGRLTVTLRNPLDRPINLSGAGQKVSLPANGQQTVTLRVAAAEIASWQAPVWRSDDRALTLQATTKVIALKGQHAPIYEHREEVSRPTVVPKSSDLQATDEVTLACWIRSDGPSETWQVPVSKWHRDSTRNYGLYLGREKGELHFSASFEKNPSPFTDLSSGTPLFDGRWHRVAVTYSKHDAEICFYVDGKLVKRQSMDGGDLKPTATPIAIANGFPAAKDKTSKQPAAVRGIRIWNRALSAEELADVKL